MAPKLSGIQQNVLVVLAEHPGVPLVRRDGGFWTWQGCPEQNGVPAWFVTVQTVRAMERAGVLRRSGRYRAEWQDDRDPVEWKAVK